VSPETGLSRNRLRRGGRCGGGASRRPHPRPACPPDRV